MRHKTFPKLIRPRVAIALLVAIAQFFFYLLPPTTYSLVAPAQAQVIPSTNSEVAQALIAGGHFTAPQYTQFIGLLLFEQAYSALDTRSLLTLLIDQGVITEGISSPDHLIERLRAKGIDVADMQLRPDGVLTALADIRGEGTLYKAQTGETEVNRLMRDEAVKNQLRMFFQQDRTAFLNYLPRTAFLKLLGAQESSEITTDPIKAFSVLDMEGDHVINPIGVGYKYDTQLWTGSLPAAGSTCGVQAHDMALKLRELPAGKRFIRFSNQGLNFRKEDLTDLITPHLDPVKNGAGVIQYRIPPNPNGATEIERAGTPYEFPSMTGWVSMVQQRLASYLCALKAEEAPGEVLLDGIIVDYENVRLAAYDYFFKENGYREGNAIDKFFADPRSAGLLQEMDLTETELREKILPKVLNTSTLKWDHYLWLVRERAAYDALIAPVKQHWPNVTATNYQGVVKTNLIPYDLYYRFFNAWGLGAVFPGGIPSKEFYARGQLPIRTPSGTFNTPTPPLPPRGFDDVPNTTNYRTIFNTIAYSILEAHSISAASGRPTRPWLAHPDINAQSFGPNGVYSLGTTEWSGGQSMDNHMAEVWYRTGAEADMIHLYNDTIHYCDESRGTCVPRANQFINDTLAEINEMFGFSDRQTLFDGVIEVNGQSTWVGPHALDLTRHSVIWGARANGKNVYRVVLDINDPAKRTDTLRKNGEDGQVEIWVPKFEGEATPPTLCDRADRTCHEIVTIPNALIYTPTTEVSKMGFWVVQDDPQAGKILQAELATILEELGRPITLPPAITVAQDSYMVTVSQLLNVPFSVTCGAPPCEVTYVGDFPGGTVIQGETLPPPGSDRDAIEVGP